MMKRMIAFTLAVIVLAGQPAWAARGINTRDLRISGTRITAYDMTSGSSETSDPIRIKGNVGYAALQLSVDASGDLDIYAEYSSDTACNSSSVFSRPYIAAMDGTVTVEGLIYEGATNITGQYVPFIPRMAPCVRFVLDPDADSTVTVTLVYQEDD